MQKPFQSRASFHSHIRYANQNDISATSHMMDIDDEPARFSPTRPISTRSGPNHPDRPSRSQTGYFFRQLQRYAFEILTHFRYRLKNCHLKFSTRCMIRFSEQKTFFFTHKCFPFFLHFCV